MKFAMRHGLNIAVAIYLIEAAYKLLFDPVPDAHIGYLQTAILFAVLANSYKILNNVKEQ